jgi:HlyD family secretion protein
LRPEVWTSFKVLEAAPHGKRVRKGDVLVKFDDKDIEKAIAEKEVAQRLGELALMEAEEEFPRTEKSIALNYEQAQREYQQAKDEYDRFEKQMREMSEKLAEYYLKSAEQDFESAQEELDQLVKMYEADELTEETEEIVLRRQKFQVEAAKFFVDYSKINHDYTMNVSIPRREEMLKTAVELAKIEFERAKMAKSLGMNKQRYEMQSLRESRARSVENHAKLLEDRELMTLKAPADGIAYYGRQVNGRWIEVSSLEQKLVPFGTVTPNSVVMTIVKDRPMYVETSIGEKELPTVDEDQEATVVPAADSDVELKGSVAKVADVPGGGNKFAVRIEVKDEKIPDWLMPGMTGKAKITTYDVKDAVVIPADLVQTDEDDPKKKYVMVQVEDEEQPVRRDIKLGKTKAKEVEVLKGLEKGDEIVKGAKDEASDEEDKDEADAEDKE